MFWEKCIVMVSLIGFFTLCLLNSATAQESSLTDLLDDVEYFEIELTTAAKQSEKISEIPASVVVITRHDIESYGYRTLTEILENIPGLFTIDDYSRWGVNYGVRGFVSGETNKNVIIMINGIPQPYELAANYVTLFIPINVETISRIEVVRGPMSVIYGSGAFFGVINIMTHDANQEAVSLLGATAGTHETIAAMTRLEKKSDTFSYTFNGSWRNTRGIDQPLDKMMSNPGLLPFWGLDEDTETGDRLDKDEKYVNMAASYGNFSFDFSYLEGNHGFYWEFPTYDDPLYDGGDTRLVSGFTRVSLGYDKQLSEKLTLGARLTHHYNHLRYYINLFSQDILAVDHINAKVFEAEFNAFYNPSSKWGLQTGLHYRIGYDYYLNFDTTVLGPQAVNELMFLEGNLVTRAAFGQINYNVTDNLRIVAGLRAEEQPNYTVGHITSFGYPEYTFELYDTDLDEMQVIPRFAAIYSLNDNNVFKLLYGRAINRPSFYQHTNIDLPQGEAIEDYLLDSEKIETIELNYTTTFSRRVRGGVSVFQNNLENLITREVRFVSDDAFYTFATNAGETRTNGLEVSLRLDPIKDLAVELSTTYQDTEDQRDGFEDIDVAYSPQMLGYFKVAFHRQRPEKCPVRHITVSLIGNYVDEMETYWDVSRLDANGNVIENPNGPNGGRIGQPVDAHLKLSANVRLSDVLKPGVFVNVHAINLLDEDIYYPTTVENDWADLGTLGQGRTILVSAGWEF